MADVVAEVACTPSASADVVDLCRAQSRGMKATAALPPIVAGALDRMRRGEGSPALVVTGNHALARDAPETPSHWRTRPDAATDLVDAWLTSLGARLGGLFSWSTLQDGRLLNDVVPIRGEELEQTGHGSTAGLQLHVEDAFDDQRADFLLLACIRNPRGIPTTVSCPRPSDLDPRHREALFASRYVFAPDTEHVRGGAAGDAVASAVLTGSRDAPRIRLDLPFMEVADGDARAQEALEALVAHLEERAVDVALSPGDVLVIDNRRAVHGRRSFRARYDGTDRWLRKAMVAEDLGARADAASATVRQPAHLEPAR